MTSRTINTKFWMISLTKTVLLITISFLASTWKFLVTTNRRENMQRNQKFEVFPAN